MTDEGKQSIRGKIKEQKSALIQEEILSAAARLIAERGFRAVTVDDICSEIGYTKSAVYYHMENKNEILWRIFEKIDNTYSVGLDRVFRPGGTHIEILEAVVKMHCLNVISHRDWAMIYNRDENELTEQQRAIVDANRRRYNKRIQELYQDGVAAGEFRDTPPVIAVSCVIGACNWLYTWFKPNGRYSAEQIAAEYAKQLIGGVVAQQHIGKRASLN